MTPVHELSGVRLLDECRPARNVRYTSAPRSTQSAISISKWASRCGPGVSLVQIVNAHISGDREELRQQIFCFR